MGEDSEEDGFGLGMGRGGDGDFICTVGYRYTLRVDGSWEVCLVALTNDDFPTRY